MAWTGNKEGFCVLESVKIAQFDICRVTKCEHTVHLQGSTENWSISPSVNMLSFGFTILVTVPQRSEIPEGLMNNPVHSILETEVVLINYDLREIYNILFNLSSKLFVSHNWLMILASSLVGIFEHMLVMSKEANFML
jgi:hypothetical protein